MAYDPVKAHEYYMQYRKKGLKKGRKKGSGKAKTKTTSTGLVGVTSAGLNDAGKMEYAMIKDDLKKEMNAALAKAESDEEKAQIRRNYQNKFLAAVQKLKSDSKYAQPQAVKASSSKSGSSSKSSSGRSSGSSKTSGTSESVQSRLTNIESMLSGLSTKLAALSAERKEQVKSELSDLVNKIRYQLNAGNGPDSVARLDWDKLSRSLSK